MISKINRIVSEPFKDSKDLLRFYQAELPKRVGKFRLDEVGPIMSVGSKEEIDGYIKNRFYFNGIGLDMADRIDWYGTPNGDLEWNGGFVRHGYFMYLADAYEKTGDEIYAKTIISHMLDYIRNVPPYHPEGKSYLEYKKSTWRPFEVAGRAAENWPVALAKIISSKSMTPEAFAEIYYSIYQHAKFLSKYHWKTGNHACLEVAGLGVLTIFYKEFAQAQQWRQYAVDFLMGMFEEEFHQDGYTQEMSGAYHWVALRNFFAFYQVALQNSLDDIFPQKYLNYIKKVALAEFYQQKPDYSLPITNDSNVTTKHDQQLRKLDCLIDPDMLAYRFSEQKKGTAPENASFYFEDARVGIMRTDWTSKAVYLSIDMGRWGTNHMNEDQLNIELSAYGRNLLVNCGRWRYTTSPNVQWLDKAQYFKTTAAYNSVLCDGFSQMPSNASGSMSITEKFDYAKGIFSGGYGENVSSKDEQLLKTKGVTAGKICRVDNVTHTREVFFCKPYFFIIRDTVKTDGRLTIQQIWHMAEGNILCPNQSCVYSDFDDANFVLMQLNNPVLQTFKGSETPFKGWTCPKYDELCAAPELNYSLSGNGTIVFETLLVPVCGKVDKDHLPVFKKEIFDNRIEYIVGIHDTSYRIQAADTWKIIGK